jgi:hypothetical protein
LTAAGLLLAAGGSTAIYEIHAAAAAPAKIGGPVDMRIRWVVGKKYGVRKEFKQSTETQVPGQPQPIGSEVNVGQDLDFSVRQELPGGGRQLEMQFADVTLDVAQGSRKLLSFDSTQSPAQDAENPIAPMFRLLQSAHIQYFTDANGSVEKVEGVDDLLSRTAGTGKSPVQAVFREIFNENTLKQYGNLAELMPNRTVNIGDQWSLKKDVPSLSGQCAHIQMAGTLSTKTISTASGAAVAIKKGEISGDVWFDPELGMIVAESSDQTLKLDVTIQAKTMASQLKQKIRWVLVSVK